MTRELFHISNRRRWARVQAQAPVQVEQGPLGYTLDVSLRGARIVARRPLSGAAFPLRIEIEPEGLTLEAECMWTQPLGTPGLTVAGLRFQPTEQQQHSLERWMEGRKRAS
jgi:hypothetical protein